MANPEIPTKRQRIVELRLDHPDWTLLEIANQAAARPSYVAQVLRKSGLLESYFDLYTTTGDLNSVYSPQFRGVLGFRDVGAARRSIARIDELYVHFERLGDRAGQHHAMVIALTGMNRARFSGKLDEAEIFRDWLLQRSAVNRLRRAA